ncbi:MAG: hypothetical protein ACD_7C00124G0002 [uncultured bacterium]|nr:MAG: hypothetical protein ACD_7C00124G0002 [uncultured bacterium]HBR79568.1 hypothetical protein [Candidatus Moranbacteria bacterium]
MSIKDTEKKLYDSSDSDIERRGHSESEFDLEKSNENKIHFVEKKSNWEETRANWLDNDKKTAIYLGAIILGIVIIFALGYIGITKFKQTAFSENKVNIIVEGPETADSARNTRYIIKYKNSNRISLENVEINLNHSENFYPQENENIKIENDRNVKISLGKIKAFASGEIEISGKFYAAENYMVYLQPTLKYKPQNFNSFFEATSQFGVRITSSPVELAIKTPQEALDESVVEYEISYENKEGVNLANLNLKLEYSEGLIFQNSMPTPISGNNVWYVGDLDVGARGSIKIKSKVDGQQYDVKLIKAIIYSNENGGEEIVYGKSEEVIKVVVPPLAIDLKVNGKNAVNINLGRSLNYKITYANRGNIGFKDVVIKLKIDSPAIDYTKIGLERGAYNSTTKDFTWKVSDLKHLSRLEPGDGGQIDLEIPLKEDLAIVNPEDKNYIIEALATIDSSDVAYHSLGNSKNITSAVLSKLNSKIIFENLINYEDNDIKNYGPVPAKHGEETTYAVNWKIKNVSNAVSDFKVYAVIPTWLKWKGVVFPQGEDITFNERTNEITWNIGNLENGVGFLSSPREIKFQLGVVPEANQNERDLRIKQEIKITGKDTFTNEDIEINKNYR